jgi:hypothetical protein
MSLKTYMYRCPHHGLFDRLVEFEKRNEVQLCADCGEPSDRTWEHAGPRVMRNSYIDGTGRFDNLRTAQKLRKARSAAKETGDMDALKEVRSEIKERKNKDA